MFKDNYGLNESQPSRDLCFPCFPKVFEENVASYHVLPKMTPVCFHNKPSKPCAQVKKNLRLRPGHIQPQQGIPAVQLGESRDIGTSQDRQTGIIPPAGADGMELLRLPKTNHI